MLWRTTHRCVLGVFVLALARPPPAGARAFEVRLLEGNESSGVWGTDEFRVTVRPSGLLRRVTVNGAEIIPRAAALYTFPIPRGGGTALRMVQGEGYGKRGLSVAPPKMTTRAEGGTRIFEFRHLVGNPALLDGRPLCKIEQRMIVTPTGEIDVSYDFEWLETLHWQSFMLLLFLSGEHCTNREFLLATDDLLRVGTLDPGPRGGNLRQIRFLPFSQFTVRPEVGPVHFVWPIPARCSLYWGKDIQLRMEPRGLVRAKPILSGQKARIRYRVLLPVSLQ